MSKQEQQQPRSKWNEPSLAQRLSHRTILRFQLLADELQQDLNALSLFSLSDQKSAKGKIKDVFFVSRDSRKSERGTVRYYNARLLATYGFPREVWAWLRSEEGKKDGHLKKFEPLFHAARRNYQAFEDAILKERDCERAHDLLIAAVADLPYTGLLITLFEEAFGLNDRKPDSPQCCWFEPKGKTIAFTRFCNFTAGHTLFEKEPDAMTFPADVVTDHPTPLVDLFNGFINDFMRGARPKAKGDWPYNSALTPLRGFVVPAYDTWDKASGWQGSMAGWIVVIVDKNSAHQLIKTNKPSLTRKQNWIGFTRALRHFVRRVRRAQMDELLEQYAREGSAAADDRASYFSDHFHKITGWRVTGLSPELNAAQFVKFKPSNINQDAQLHVRLSSKDDVFVVLGPTDDTILHKNKAKRRRPEQYLDTVAWARSFWLRLSSLYAERRSARLQGRADVSHDFSYTIRTTLSTVRDIAADVETLRGNPSRFPVATFEDLPSQLRDFLYPAQLYVVALRQACIYEPESNDFLRAIPRITWIEDALKASLGAALILRLSESIAKPLAVGSLAQFSKPFEKVEKASLNIDGDIPANLLLSTHESDKIILVGVVVELLREAFQHCNPNDPRICVRLAAQPLPQIRIENTCLPGEAVIEGGNQAKTLSDLMARLQRWELARPTLQNGMWSRCLEYK